MVPGPAWSRVATRDITVSPSPESSAPTRPARSASRTPRFEFEGIAAEKPKCEARRASPAPLFVGERFDHLFGDIDALARIHDGILQDQVELLGLGNLQDDLVRALLESCELLVSPQVHVFAKLSLSALQITRKIREITLFVAAIIFRHRCAVLVENSLQIAHLLRQLLNFGIARRELALKLLLRAFRGCRFAEQTIGVDETDLVVERRRNCRESDERRAEREEDG